MPGMTVCPARSITCAPCGGRTDDDGPTAAILSPWMTIVWFSAGAAPVPSTTRTFVRATTGASTLTKRRVFWERAGRACCCWAARGRAVSARSVVTTVRCIESLDSVVIPHERSECRDLVGEPLTNAGEKIPTGTARLQDGESPHRKDGMHPRLQ